MSATGALLAVRSSLEPQRAIPFVWGTANGTDHRKLHMICVNSCVVCSDLCSCPVGDSRGCSVLAGSGKGLGEAVRVLKQQPAELGLPFG